MTRRVLITGVSGAGKTTVCRELQDRGYAAFDLEAVNGLCEMIDPATGEPFDGYDPNDVEDVKRGEWLCDKERLADRLRRHQEPVVFYGGITSNLEALLSLFDQVILLAIDPDVLCERLRTRTTNSFGRAREVQEHVLSWKDEWEQDLRAKGAIEVDANGGVAETVEDILEAVEGPGRP